MVILVLFLFCFLLSKIFLNIFLKVFFFNKLEVKKNNNEIKKILVGIFF